MNKQRPTDPRIKALLAAVEAGDCDAELDAIRRCLVGEWSPNLERLWVRYEDQPRALAALRTVRVMRRDDAADILLRIECETLPRGRR